jgi:hypothetical protein
MKIETKTVTFPDGTSDEIVFIYGDNNDCTQMRKSFYDEQQAQAKQSTPMVTDDPKP